MVDYASWEEDANQSWNRGAALVDLSKVSRLQEGCSSRFFYDNHGYFEYGLAQRTSQELPLHRLQENHRALIPLDRNLQAEYKEQHDTQQDSYDGI